MPQALLSGLPGSIRPQPWLFDYVARWAKDPSAGSSAALERQDYYANTALRGDLSDIRPTKSFFGFHPHGARLKYEPGPSRAPS